MKVSSAIRERVEQEALATAKNLNKKPEEFNQDCCAVVNVRLQATAKSDVERLEIAYICANASALRQAISSTKKQEKGAAISEDLLKMVKR